MIAGMDISRDITALENERLLNLMSIYLNEFPTAVTAEDIAALAEFDIPVEEAFALTLAGLLELDVADNPADRAFFDRYFAHMFHCCRAADFADDPYLANISFPTEAFGNARFEMARYEPFEGFVCDDFSQLPDGRIIPHIGFFEEAYPYPTVMEDGRIWMSVTPQEINTVRPAVEAARGHVVTFGLGLGYFAYMAARKPEVQSVTVVDSNESIIEVFSREILPQFERPGIVDIVCDDAFDFAEKRLVSCEADFIYTDIWHDVGDGFDLYAMMREYEFVKPDAEWQYWIEPTIRCYL